MQAIRTMYAGIEFRSGLEARYAKFFDTVGIKWIYEPEGYQLSNGVCYLPDFYLPDSGQFFEVKGIMTQKDMDKIEDLVYESSRSVVIGLPDGKVEIWDYEDLPMYNGSLERRFTKYDSSETVLAKCRKCGKWWFMNSVMGWQCRCCGEYDGDGHIEKWLEGQILQDYFRAIQIKVGKWN